MRQDVLRIARLVVAAVLALTVTAKAAEPTVEVAAEDNLPRETVLRIHGSTTIGSRLLHDLLVPFLRAEGWSELKEAPAAEGGSYTVVGRPPGAAKLAGVYVEISNPENALTALDQGFADIAMSSRRVRPIEVRQLAKLGDLTSPNCEHVLALDAVAVIVNPSNPVDTLTRQQLKDIYLRRLTSWQEVGGRGPIHVYARDGKSGTGATFQSAILDDREISPETNRLPDNLAVAEAVAADPRGVGFVAHTFAGANHIVALSDGKPESQALQPVAVSIRNGEYPLARRLYLYTAAQPENALAKKFVGFATGRAGQAIVLQDGFVSPTLEPPAPREPVSTIASNPPATPPPAPPETRPIIVPAAPAARLREVEPARTPRARAEPAEPRPTPTPRPPRPTASRPPAAPAVPTPAESSSGTGG